MLARARRADRRGAAASSTRPRRACCRRSCPREQLQEANGLRATALSAGEIAGPVSAGVLIAAVGPGWALAVDAATFAVSAAFLAVCGCPRVASASAASFLADLREGWGVFRSLTWVWAFVLAAGVGNLLWGAWSVLGPVVAERELGGAAAWGPCSARWASARCSAA